MPLLSVWNFMKFFAHLIIVSAVVHSLTLSVAFATHEVDHRYNVTGYVLDENKIPIANSAVEIHMDNRLVGSAETDSQGLYNIQLHLHDVDLNKKLEVRAADSKATIQVTFTRGDTSTKRVHHASFIGGKLVEGELTGMGFPRWGYAALVLLGAVPVAMLVRRKSRHSSTSDEKGSVARRQRKRKRRKRK